MAEIDTSPMAIVYVLEWIRNGQNTDSCVQYVGAIAAQRDTALARAEKAEHRSRLFDEAAIRLAEYAKLINDTEVERDTALARAEKAELVNECHCVNVEALTTERDTAEAQLTTALARVAKLEDENARMRAVVKNFADPANWHEGYGKHREWIGKRDAVELAESAAILEPTPPRKET